MSQRLLWRGNIRLKDSKKVYPGLAIVAHGFATTSDLCLAIEMSRGREMELVSVVDVVPQRKYGGSPRKRSATVVEAGESVMMYVDPRCILTRYFLERSLFAGKGGGEAKGLKLDIGGEHVILYGKPQTSASSSTSTRLNLVIAKEVIKKPEAEIPTPRPDDPLPRDQLFGLKMTHTVSKINSLGSRTGESRSTDTKRKALDRRASSTAATATMEESASKRRMPGMSDDSEGYHTDVPKSPTPLQKPSIKRETSSPAALLPPPLSQSISRASSVGTELFSKSSNLNHDRLAKNKISLRKRVHGQILKRGITQQNPLFNEMFSIVYKGVQLALRNTISIQPLDHDKALHLINSHLDMYI